MEVSKGSVKAMCDIKQDSLPEENGAQPPAEPIERIERNEAGQLVVHLVGHSEPIVDAKVARCFPWSLPEEYVSICDADGREIRTFELLDELPPASRKVVQEELRDKVFNPKIRRVIEWKSEFGVTSIRAETDRGEVMFQLRTRDDIRILSPVRALLRDVDGNVYELEDLTAVDANSRKFFDQYF